MSKGTPLTIKAHFRYEDATMEWIATAADYGNVQARRIDMRQDSGRERAAGEDAEAVRSRFDSECAWLQ